MKTRYLLASISWAAVMLSLVSALEMRGAEEEPWVALTRGPYVQMTTKTGALLRWRTDEVAPSQVRFGLEPGELNRGLIDLELSVDHRVQLSNLAPGTRYYYAISDTFGQLAGGPEFYFTTAPANPGPTRIWAIGDAGTASAGDFGSWLVRDAYYEYAGNRETDVWLMLGDNAYGVGTDAEYQVAVFDTYTSLLRRSAVWSTLGNHETYAQLPNGSFSYFDIFDFPTQGEAGGVPSGTERYYSFNYANIHFVCIDSELSARGLESPMLTWLDADLSANTNEWVIAYWHSPPYTKGSHDSDSLFDNRGNMTQMRTNVNPVLEAHGVDLVLNGHSHNYERSHLLKGHYGFSWELVPSMVLDGGSGQEENGEPYRKADSGPNAGEGTVYIVAGSSGWATFQTGFHPVMHTAQLNRGSVVIDIDDRRMDVRYLRETGAIDDHFTMIKGSVPEPLHFTTIRVVDGFVIARWNSLPGRTYRIQKSSELPAGEWVTVSDDIVATGNSSGWEDIVSQADTKCFYRVLLVP